MTAPSFCRFLTLFLLSCSFFFASGQLSNPTGLLKDATAAPERFTAERLKRIDANMQSWVTEGRMNGGVALIVHKGNVVYQKGFGYDDPEKKIPIRPDHIYRIASQTKAITSVAVMMLYEEGKFLLDDPVSRYIPEFAKPTVLDKFNEADSSYTTVPAKSEITIRQLLTHTSGIGYAFIGSKESNAIYAKAGLTAGIGSPIGKLLSADMKTLGKLPLMHQPGERFTYGLNTDLLGYLVEVVSGQSLDAFFRERIFEPLGMKDTYFNVPPAKQQRIVRIYEGKDNKLVPAEKEIRYNGGIFIQDYPKMPNTYFSGGAGLSSTAYDYAIFLQMMLNGGTYNGKRLLSRNTVRMMTMNQSGDLYPGPNDFGLGFSITTKEGSRELPIPEGTFEWGGAFTTTYWADPKENLIGIFFRQLWRIPYGEDAVKFKVLVYQALE